MLLVEHGQIVTNDPWLHLTDDAPVPADASVIVSLERWHAERDTLGARNRPVGVRLEAGEMVDEIAADLDRLALVALAFPTFRDGRAYSKARILRDRYGFRGQLRAVGNVLRDQFMFMARCGFDAVEVADQEQAEAWQAELARFSVVYQPATDDRTSAAEIRRHRLRSAAE